MLIIHDNLYNNTLLRRVRQIINFDNFDINTDKKLDFSILLRIAYFRKFKNNSMNFFKLKFKFF